MQKELQDLYDTCNWYGFATYKGKKVFVFDVILMAKEKDITLIYNCLA